MALQLRRVALCLLVACDLGGVYDDGYWDETHPDDGDGGDVVVTSAAGADKKVGITPGETNHAELVELLSVARSESGATRKVVLQLRPSDLPQLAKGDRLITPAEVQVTTRCDIGQSAPGCNYNPNVRAQLILTGNANDTSGGGSSKVISTQTQTCTKNAHHCMFVFRPAGAAIVLGNEPCVATSSCFVNVVMWAWHPDARGGDQDKVLVGGNDGNYLDNGRVEGDGARLMAVRERNIGAADRAARATEGGGNKNLNTNANPELLYSLKLKQGTLHAGERFLVEARVVADTASRARVSTQLFLTKNPDATDGDGVDKIHPAAISEQNGYNCDGGCVLQKVAVFEVADAIAEPVYINLVAKSAVPGGGSTRVTIKRDAGWLRLVRYLAR